MDTLPPPAEMVVTANAQAVTVVLMRAVFGRERFAGNERRSLAMEVGARHETPIGGGRGG